MTNKGRYDGTKKLIMVTVNNAIFDFSVYRGFLALLRQNAGRIQIKFTYSDDLSH